MNVEKRPDDAQRNGDGQVAARVHAEASRPPSQSKTGSHQFITHRNKTRMMRKAMAITEAMPRSVRLVASDHE